MTKCKYEKHIREISDALDHRKTLQSLKEQGVIFDFLISGKSVKVRPTRGLDWMERVNNGPWVVRHVNRQHFIQGFSDL